jgi:hypothetical protein
MQLKKIAPKSWTPSRVPLGWSICEVTKIIAYTTPGLGEVEAESIARQITKALDMQAALDAALQSGKVFLPLHNT